MLLQLTDVVLDRISSFLPIKDFLRLTMTNSSLNEYYRRDIYWEKLMTKNLWMEKRFLTFHDDLLFLVNNSPNKHLKTSSICQKVIRFSVFSNDGTMTAFYGNGCRLWVFRQDTELFHIFLSEKRMWEKILTVSFSPDDHHLMVTGTVDQVLGGTATRECLMFEIREDKLTLKSWVVLDRQMLATWYDNSNILYMSNEGIHDRMRLYISSIDNTSDIMVYPILTFNKRITKILIAQHVSPRTRKIVQIANQASHEGKTLSEKLLEIGIDSGVDITDMNALKAILDQNNECMPCYRLHAHREAVAASQCSCACHQNTDKLLVFYANDEKVHAKVIGQKMLEDAKDAWRSRGEQEHPDHNRLFFPLIACTDFDLIDYSFNINYSLFNNAACFSPDHRYLFLTGTRRLENCTVIKPTCIDLETMIVRKVPDFEVKPWIEFEYDVRISANKDFVAMFVYNEVYIWSTYHQGKVLDRIGPFDGFVSSVAIHPVFNILLITNHRLIHTFQSPYLSRELHN